MGMHFTWELLVTFIILIDNLQVPRVKIIRTRMAGFQDE